MHGLIPELLAAPSRGSAGGRLCEQANYDIIMSLGLPAMGLPATGLAPEAHMMFYVDLLCRTMPDYSFHQKH